MEQRHITGRLTRAMDSPQNIFNSEPHDDKGLDIKEDFGGLVFVVLHRGQNAQGQADEDGAKPETKAKRKASEKLMKKPVMEGRK